jgi:hypothetical protein
VKKTTITLAAGVLLAATAASSAIAATSTSTPAATTADPAAPTVATAPQTADAQSTRAAQRWAAVWARRMRANARHARQHARLLGKRLPKALALSATRPAEPGAARAVTELDWKAYGTECKQQAVALGRYVKATWRRISHPRTYNSAAVWAPLLRHEGWPAAQIPTALKVIWRESNAQPSCVGPGPYYGLFQLYSGFNNGGWDLCDPVVNVRLSLQLYHRRGWQPWSATAY